MKIFPVSSSHLSACHLAEFLKEKYELKDEAKCEFIRGGINDTYLVTSENEKFIFRIYSLNWRTEKEISEELRLLHLLKDHKIPVSYPISDKTGNEIQTLNAPEGERSAVLFTYAEGEKKHDLPADLHYQVGCVMATLHKVLNNKKMDRVHYTPEVLLEKPLSYISQYLSADSEEMQWMRSTQTVLLNELSKVNPGDVKQGIVHLDIWFDNMHISQENEISIFDFDFCGNGWLCLDIAFYVAQLTNVERYDADMYGPKIKSFLAGYESITPISTEEKRLLPLLGTTLYYFYLGIQCQRYENWSNTFLSENYLKRYIKGIVMKYDGLIK